MSDPNHSSKLAAVKKNSKKASKVDVLATGITTGVAASVLIQAGQGILGILVRRPLVMFSMGIATGYFSYKYRKEIISIGNKAAEQGKDFVLRQKENIK
ncbi:MAG: hypothetical protein ABL925_16015, partial [Methylococcales bacterium]